MTKGSGSAVVHIVQISSSATEHLVEAVDMSVSSDFLTPELFS